MNARLSSTVRVLNLQQTQREVFGDFLF